MALLGAPDTLMGLSATWSTRWQGIMKQHSTDICCKCQHAAQIRCCLPLVCPAGRWGLHSAQDSGLSEMSLRMAFSCSNYSTVSHVSRRLKGN